MKGYRVSALASGFVRMWRGWTVIVPVVLANALVQGLLVWPVSTPMIDTLAIVVAVVSGLVFLAAYALVAATALRVADGRVWWDAAFDTLRTQAVRYTLWAIGLGLVIAVGFVAFSLPGLLVLAATPFVLLAVLDGQANPLAANVRTIRRRFWRWLVTVLVMGVVIVVGDLGAGLFTFFTRVPVASFAVWLVAGLVFAWFTTAWALVYRGAAAHD